MARERRLLKFILPAKLYAAMRLDTKRWLIECACGHKRDLWEVGGIRYKAKGEPRTRTRCPACGQRTWHKIRRKTDAEQQELP